MSKDSHFTGQQVYIKYKDTRQGEDPSNKSRNERKRGLREAF